jgi:hypothetical protein
MGRKGKLRLMNTRLAGPRQACAVHDSSLDQDLPNTMSTLGTSNYDFDKMLRRDQLRDPVIYHTNEIVDPAIHTHDGINSRKVYMNVSPLITQCSSLCLCAGEKVTFKQRIDHTMMKTYVKERRSNHFELLLNDTAQTFRTARKIDTTLCKWFKAVACRYYEIC